MEHEIVCISMNYMNYEWPCCLLYAEKISFFRLNFFYLDGLDFDTLVGIQLFCQYKLRYHEACKYGLIIFDY